MLSSTSNLPNSNFCRASAMKIIFDMKFAILRLWFQVDESFNSNENSSNNEEIEQMINTEFVSVLNEWLDDSIRFQNKNIFSVDLKQPTNSNQINGFVEKQINLSNFDIILILLKTYI